MYEYVKKSEYEPVRHELEDIIRKVHHYMREKYGVTFQHKLIGSGHRHLITRKREGNKGFDFDYNFIIPHPAVGYEWKADVLKNQFMEALKFALKGTAYTNPKDSTSAITIKVVSRKESQIKYGCDFAIIYYPENENFNGYYYLKHNKEQKSYCFEKRSTYADPDGKLKSILDDINGWGYIKDEYITLKNKNKDPDKGSYVLYLESINNVYNRMFRTYSFGCVSYTEKRSNLVW